MPKLNFNCKYCNVVFTTNRPKHRPAKYCTQECYFKDKRKISIEYKLNCIFCLRPFNVVRPGYLPKPKFCCHKCYSLNKRPPFVYKNGYKLVYNEKHPRADIRGLVREHLLVMEEKIGRPVLKKESVHHIDGDKTNNHPDNLLLFANHSEHLKYEWKNKTFLKS